MSRGGAIFVIPQRDRLPAGQSSAKEPSRPVAGRPGRRRPTTHQPGQTGPVTGRKRRTCTARLVHRLPADSVRPATTRLHESAWHRSYSQTWSFLNYGATDREAQRKEQMRKNTGFRSDFQSTSSGVRGYSDTSADHRPALNLCASRVTGTGPTQITHDRAHLH